MITVEKKQVVAAITQLGRRVTVSDVARQTGLPLNVATQELNKLAAQTNGILEVSEQGTIVYSFKPTFEHASIATGLKRAVQTAGRTAFHFGYFLLRISFGITLIASLITIALLFLLVILQIVNKGSDGNTEGSGFTLDWFDINDFASFFTWQIAAHQFGSDYDAYTRGDYSIPGDKPQKQSFLLNCYSFLFGDGNPNANFEELTWQTIAARIVMNGGVMTNEQFSCYSASDPQREYNALPLLVRFEGVPTVTDTGNIVYAFPSLLITASTATQAIAARSDAVPDYMEQKHWAFTNRSFDEMAIIAGFGLINLVGAVALLLMPPEVADFHRVLPLIHGLVAYGTFFLLFPLLRFIVLRIINDFIDVKNDLRAGYYSSFSASTPERLQKEQEAQQLAMAMQQVRADQIVYTTQEDLLAQELKQL